MKTHVKKITLAILPLVGWLFAAPVVCGDDLAAECQDGKADQKAAQQELKANHKAARQEQMAALGLVLLLLGSPGSLFIAAPWEHAMKKELQKFQGTWVMVEEEVDGKKTAEEFDPSLSNPHHPQSDLSYGTAAQHCTSTRSPGIIRAETPIVALVYSCRVRIF